MPMQQHDAQRKRPPAPRQVSEWPCGPSACGPMNPRGRERPTRRPARGRVPERRRGGRRPAGSRRPAEGAARLAGRPHPFLRRPPARHDAEAPRRSSCWERDSTPVPSGSTGPPEPMSSRSTCRPYTPQGAGRGRTYTGHRPAHHGRRRPAGRLARRAACAAGFDAGRPTAWLCEGLLFYLAPEAVERLIGTVSALSAPGSSLGAECLDADTADSPFVKPWLEALSGSGTPWVWHLADAERWWGGYGWRASRTCWRCRTPSSGSPRISPRSRGSRRTA